MKNVKQNLSQYWLVVSVPIYKFVSMVSEETNGIVVSVETQYQIVYSVPADRHYVFAYFVTIRNNTDNTVRLLRRHWYIYEQDGEERQVEGAGVIGEQPILEPGDAHRYESGCNFKTTQGKMRGTYLMQRMPDGEQFKVIIPEFVMTVPKMFH